MMRLNRTEGAGQVKSLYLPILTIIGGIKYILYELAHQEKTSSRNLNLSVCRSHFLPYVYKIGNNRQISDLKES